jgi:hypothetical protein
MLYVSLPNIASSKAKKMKEKWEALKPVEHLFFFSPKILKKLFEKAGFDITQMDTSISIIDLEGLQRIGLPVRESLRIFINRYLSVPKSLIRHFLGKILQGEGIEILAKPKVLKTLF